MERDPENSRPRVFWLPVTCCLWVLGWATASIFGYLWIEVKHSAFSELIPVSIMMKAGCYDGWCSWCGGAGDVELPEARPWAFRATWRSFKWWASRENIWRHWWSLCKSAMLPGLRSLLESTQSIHVNSNLVVGLVVRIVLKPGHTSYFNWKDPELRKRTSSHRKLPWISSLPRSRWSQARYMIFLRQGALW